MRLTELASRYVRNRGRYAATALVVASLAACVLTSPASAGGGNKFAERVFGYPNFDVHQPTACYQGGVTASNLCLPVAAAVDQNGHLFVADQYTDRVLVYSDPFTSAVADHVLGQPDFVTSGCSGITATTLCEPSGVAVDAVGHLYVADLTNNRVLEYDDPLTNAQATRVFGQPDLQSGFCNNGGRSATSLCQPIGVVIDSGGRLWVADELNHRVLEYDHPSCEFGGGSRRRRTRLRNVGAVRPTECQQRLSHRYDRDRLGRPPLCPGPL